MTPITYLFVPALRTERIAKAFAAGAHAVIVDLEDAVDIRDKSRAREQLDDFLSSSPQPVWLRVNAVSTPWFADDKALIEKHCRQLAGVMLAKTESGADIDALEFDGAPALPVIALIESARGVLRLGDICTHPRLSRLAYGSADLSRDLGCEDDWDVLAYTRMQLVLHSSAARLAPPIDGVTFALDQPEVVQHDAVRAARMGFAGKLCVHPSQLQPTVKGFAPSESQRQWALQVVAAADAGSGAQRLNGQLVDSPVIALAQQILQRHEALEAIASSHRF